MQCRFPGADTDAVCGTMDSITPAKITDTLPVPIAPLNTFNPRGNVILSYLDRKISGFKKSFHEARKVSKEVIIMTDLDIGRKIHR